MLEDGKEEEEEPISNFLTCVLQFATCDRVDLRWPNTVFKCTGVRRRYLETMYFWMPKIGMV